MSKSQHQGQSEQSKASQHRLEDAHALLEKQRWRGAMYVGGYALECLLKARLMKRYDCNTLDELEVELIRRGIMSKKATVFTHQLESLMQATGGMERLRNKKQTWESFLIINSWHPAWRYDPGLSSQNESTDFFEALREVIGWVSNNI